MKLEELKARIDVGKTILNHLILVIVTIGAGSFSMIKNGNFGIFSFSGIIVTILGVILYFKSTKKISQYLDEFKKIKED